MQISALQTGYSDMAISILHCFQQHRIYNMSFQLFCSYCFCHLLALSTRRVHNSDNEQQHLQALFTIIMIVTNHFVCTCRMQFLVKALICPVSCQYPFTIHQLELDGTRVSLDRSWVVLPSVKSLTIRPLNAKCTVRNPCPWITVNNLRNCSTYFKISSTLASETLEER